MGDKGKGKLSVKLILLSLFLLTQIIGIMVLNEYNRPIETIFDRNQTNITDEIQTRQLPFNLEETDEPSIVNLLLSILLAFAIFFALMKYKLKYIIKAWFIVVITLAISITIASVFNHNTNGISLIALSIAIPLVILKIMRPSQIIHNGTELLIYPGIAAILATLINPLGIIIVLILIAIYDAWAVWQSGIMQKMAKYQMEEVRIFGGLLIASMDKKTKEKLKQLKQKYTRSEIKKKLSKKKFKVQLAALGGGDIVFPLITMGVFMRTYPKQELWGIPGLIPALFILGGSLIGLTHLFFILKQKKAYPAMPWISSGILAGLLLWWIIF
ncbi:hypothetical protein HN747_01180 [archaeon]|nr:hypothetical protein [archaeon]